jgi:hypothetical protein
MAQNETQTDKHIIPNFTHYFLPISSAFIIAKKTNIWPHINVC